jgi:hypothetical protein
MNCTRDRNEATPFATCIYRKKTEPHSFTVTETLLTSYHQTNSRHDDVINVALPDNSIKPVEWADLRNGYKSCVID